MYVVLQFHDVDTRTSKKWLTFVIYSEQHWNYCRFTYLSFLNLNFDNSWVSLYFSFYRTNVWSLNTFSTKWQKLTAQLIQDKIRLLLYATIQICQRNLSWLANSGCAPHTKPVITVELLLSCSTQLTQFFMQLSTDRLLSS